MLESIGSKLSLVFVVGLVVVLVGVGIRTDVFSIQNKNTSLNVYSIGNVITNPQKYIGQKITVPGYYFQGDLSKGKGYISSEFIQQPIIEGSLDNIDLLLINISEINMTLNESVLYDFTGTLISQGNTPYPTASIILSVEKIEIA